MRAMRGKNRTDSLPSSRQKWIIGAMNHAVPVIRAWEHPLRAHAALFVMVVIWGVNFSVAKIALETLSPLAFNALRFPLAAVLLFVVLRSRRGLPLPNRDEIPRLILLGLLGNLLYQVFFIFGLDRTTAGNASLLLAATPIITALLSAALGHEELRARVWVGVLGTFAGITMIVLGGASAVHTGRGTLMGDLLMLGASATWSFYAVGSRSLIDRHGPLAVTAWTLWIGAIGIVAIGIPDLLELEWAVIPAKAWAATVYAGVLSIGLAYMIYYYGVSRIGNTRTASYSNIVPVIALVAAWLWLGEIPKLVQMVGAAIIISGVTVAQSAARTEAVSPEV
jgi:drug/metabolite transporter (DMT)-like permease